MANVKVASAALVHSSPPPSSAAAEGYLSGSNSAYVDEMYEAWAQDPASVHASWDAYFRYMLLRLPTQPLTFVIKSINI